METITMEIITPFLIELGKKGIEKFSEKGFESVSEGAINWIKSLFFKVQIPVILTTQFQFKVTT